MTQDPRTLAKSIDHTLLRPNSVRGDYQKLCAEAREHDFFSVCVPSSWVSFCRDKLNGTDVKLCTVVGFPFGYSLTETKVTEAKESLKIGAHEIDMVMNVSALLSGDEHTVAEDILSVRDLGRSFVLKVILETCYLSDDQIRRACQICEDAGADFVKSSTGYGPSGGAAEHIRLMRDSVSNRVQVKASGGIRDRATAELMISMGASRLGTSQGVAIINDSPKPAGGGY